VVVTRKFETDWHSDVKVEKWTDGAGNIEYKSIPVDFDGWTRTQTRCRNPSTIELGRQRIPKKKIILFDGPVPKTPTFKEIMGNARIEEQISVQQANSITSTVKPEHNDQVIAISTETQDVSVWKLLWNFFFGWLK